MFVQNLQSRKDTAVSAFNLSRPHLLEEFFSKNQFIRMLLRFLLSLDTSRDRAGFILIKLVFGAHAADLFLNQGINNTLIDQKNEILLQINSRLAPARPASAAKPNEFGSLETDSSKSVSADLESPARDAGRSKGLSLLRQRVEALGMSKVVLLMKIYGVPFDYIDHWVWLFSRSQQSAAKFLGFHRLLKQVYNLKLTQQQSEFDKILGMLPFQ